MLDAFRSLGQSWLARAAMVLIALSFVLWGVSGYLFSGKRNTQTVARVDGTKIATTVFRQRLEQARAQYQKVFGARTAARITGSPGFAKQVLDGMINDLLVAREARRLGLVVPNSAIASRVESMPVFARNGKFSRDQYGKVLAANGLTPAAFEAMLRQGMLMEQLQVIPQLMARVTPAEARQVWAWSQEYRDATVLTVPDSAFLAAAAPSASTVSGYYHQHPEQYQLPAQVKVQYVVLGPSSFGAGAVPATAPAASGRASTPVVSAAAASVASAAGGASSPARVAFEAQIGSFRNLLFSSVDLKAVAGRYHLPVRDSGTLTAGHPPATGVFADSRALTLAFSRAVLAGKNSAALTLGNGDLLAVHLLHYTPPATQPLSAVAAKIRSFLAAQKAHQMAVEKAGVLLAAARKEESLASWKQAAGNGLLLKHYPELARHSTTSLDPALMARIFLSAPPTAGHPVFGQVPIATGMALFELNRVIPPATALLNPGVTGQIRQSLEEQRAHLLMDAWFRSLRSHAHVQVDQKAMQKAAA